jgi:hypothetical protein
LKAILKYSLFRRPQPTNEVEANGFLSKGSTIDVQKVLAGKGIDEIGIWFYAADGFCYWGGGVDFNNNEDFFSWDELNQNTKTEYLKSAVVDKEHRLSQQISGYLGCAWGFKNDDSARGVALTIFVDAKTPVANIGKTIAYKGVNIPVDVKEVEKVSHHYKPGGIKVINPDGDMPVQMGGSISRKDADSFGTRSVVVKKNGDFYLLTCFHVLLKEFKQSGIYLTGNNNELKAEYPSVIKNPSGKRIRKDLQIIEGKYSPRYDFAVVKLSDQNDLINAFDNQFFNGFYKSDDLDSLLHKEVSMAGAVSVMQKGKVLDTKATIFVGDERARFENIVVTEKISTPGDSGAPVIDKENKIVGILIAGNDNNRSFILPIYNIVFQQGYFIDFKN